MSNGNENGHSVNGKVLTVLAVVCTLLLVVALLLLGNVRQGQRLATAQRTDNALALGGALGTSMGGHERTHAQGDRIEHKLDRALQLLEWWVSDAPPPLGPLEALAPLPYSVVPLPRSEPIFGVSVVPVPRPTTSLTPAVRP